MTQNQLGRKGFVSFRVPYHSPSLMKGSTGSKAGQESGGRGHGGVVLTGLLPLLGLLSLLCF